MNTVSFPPRVIKAAAAPECSDVIVFEDLRRQCADLVDAARDQARELLADAQAEADRLKAQAWTLGLDQGRAELAQSHEAEIAERSRALASSAARDQMRPLMAALEHAVAEVHSQRERWIAEWEGGVVSLAAGLARRILRNELSAHPELAAETLRDALSLVAGRPRVGVRIHPDDVPFLPMSDDPGQHVDVIEDSSVSRGGCLLQLPLGMVDARVETQLQRLMDELTGGTQP